MLFDPRKTGVTQSLLQKFIVCRERFRIYAIKGLKESRAEFDCPLEFGDMFHAGIEAAVTGASPEDQIKAIHNYTKRRIKEAPSIAEQANHWSLLAAVTFQEYQLYWSGRKAIESKAKHPTRGLFSEKAFRVKYPLGNGDFTILRGKFDGVYASENAPKISPAAIAKGTFPDAFPVILQENKTKGEFKPVDITQQLLNDLQTMLYLVALKRSGFEPRGILYNVIRRTQLYRRKGEDSVTMARRLRLDIRKRPSWYFYREPVPISPSDIARFERQSLRPILRELNQWYDNVIKYDDPFKAPGHYLRPFGIYDGLSLGAKGDFFNLIANGDESRMRKVTTLYAELDGAVSQSAGTKKRQA